MSLKFNNTSSPYDGLIQRCEVNVYGEDALGRISGNTEKLALWTTRLNQAKLKMDAMAFEVDGLWQHDDKNHTKLPTITADISANTRKYSFDEDQDGNKILEILKVYYRKDASSNYEILEPVDETETASIYDGQDTVGVPTAYGKKGNTIILDMVPESNITAGLKIEITREGYYFSVSDTDTEGGYDIYDYLIADLACFEYGRMNTLANANINAPYIEESKRELKKWFSRRAGDKRNIMSFKKINHI